MSKRKSLARLALERSQCSQDAAEEPLHRSSSNARPLSQLTVVEGVRGDSGAERAADRQPLPSSGASNGAAPQPHIAVIRRRPARSSGEQRIQPGPAATAATHNSRHSYPSAAGQHSHSRVGPPAGDSRPQRPARERLQRSAAERSPLVDVGSPPALSLSPPVDLDGPAAPCAENGRPCVSPSASSGSSAGSGDGSQSGLLTARAMHHAHSTNDLQGRPADGSPGPAWCEPMNAGHRARSFPTGLAGSVETLSSCSEPSAGSPLSGITVQKARSRGYLVNQTGSALLLSAEELDASLPQRQLHVLVGTWNMNAKEPPASLDDLVLPDSLAFVPDLVALGTQESHADHRGLLVRLQSTLGPSHVLFHSASLGTLHICVFIRRDLVWYCSVPEEASYSIRQPTAIKTKGCVAVGFQFFGTTFLLLTCHLTAHLEKQNQRIDDVRRICAALDLPQAIPSRSSSRDVTERYDNVFWFGDLNFRLHQSRPRVIDTIVESSSTILLRERTMSEACMRSLLEWDQLNHAKHKGRAFEGFNEGVISFLPTYKYDPGTNTFDTSHKQRIPAYTDRILFKSRRDGVRCIKYDSVQPFSTSDHKPVWGLYQCRIRPSLDSIPLAAGQFNRAVFLEGLRRRARHLPARRVSDGRPCSVQ
ncbi:inositol polyphosphate 5-phosphatase E-like [Amphibalanus amphitrite]|uniref:inositol polyphosphate 5-phosphatase E-like n=1 Tax=Amphibalanus amphitrite TaxID=1232801 RepID=UPI001C912E6E|nr:inositol polyphosphate 5-phosphatase E-like [Amphibalanus amphitrite]